MNTTPFYYDNLWKEHEIEYLKFNNYTFIKDLSYTENNCRSIILLFNYEGNNILRGYADGIIFPQINYFDIENIHTKKRDKKIQNILDYILKVFNDYNIVDTKVYQDPYLCKKLGYSIFDLLDLKQLKLKYKLEMYFEKSQGNNILTSLKSKSRTIINKYLNKTKFNIYFGEVNDTIFNSLVDKHLELSGKKTKPDKCWSILKDMIKEKKAILLVSDNNYIIYFISNKYCYYAINACTKRDSIVSYLLYEGLKWLTENKFNFIHFYTYEKYIKDEKKKCISKYKKALCNKMFTQYYLEL